MIWYEKKTEIVDHLQLSGTESMMQLKHEICCNIQNIFLDVIVKMWDLTIIRSNRNKYLLIMSYLSCFIFLYCYTETESETLVQKNVSIEHA